MLKKFLIVVGLGFMAGLVNAEINNMPDTQIAKAMVTINESEMDSADIAEDKAQNPEVKMFATMMAEEHERNREETKRLVDKYKIDMKDSALSKNLYDDSKTAQKDLKKQSKANFDKTYLAQQVMMHEKALNAIKGSFIPSVKNPELKTHLEKTQTVVASHLDHAKKLQAKLK